MRVTPAFSGTGSVRLVGLAFRLDTLTPVADSVGCFTASEPSSCIGGDPLGTEPARLPFEGGQEASLTWTVRLHDGPSPNSPPEIMAEVVMDSVRAPGGALYPVGSREARDVIGSDYVTHEARSASVRVRISRQPSAPRSEPAARLADGAASG